MKRTRALHHLETLAASCADMATRPASIFPLRVHGLWLAGDLLDPDRDEVESVTVALVVDLPVEDVPWLTEPSGARHWGNAIRLAQSPVTAYWRSAHAPVWNHRIVRPALVWSTDGGTDGDVLAALAEGDPERVRTPAPDRVEYDDRLAEEAALSLRALRERRDRYRERRWGPGKVEPHADALWQATDGYLDLLDARR